MKRADPFYKSSKWERVRRSALARDKYKCKACELKHKNTQAECVHHIFPRDVYPSYQYELWNMMSLCNKCHDEMHDHFSGGLSNRGRLFMKALAVERGIKISMSNETILVIGLSGSGKTTYCKKHIDDESLCYDLDAIAAAFRLKMPHEETFRPARKMANDFMKGFIIKAHEYARKIFIVRTAPEMDEVERIEPTKIVICKERFVNRPMDDEKEAKERIQMVESYARAVDIELEILDRS